MRGADSMRTANGALGGASSWRRFGDPAARNEVGGGAADHVAGPGRSNGNVGVTDSAGWRRIGEQPNAAARQSMPRSLDRSPQSDTGRGWNRFGAPGSSSGSAPVDRPQTAPRSQQDRSGGWQRFQPSSEAQPQMSAPSRSGRGSGSYSVSPGMDRQQYREPQSNYRGQSLQIAPPVVRERSAPDSGGYAPARGSSPRYENGPRNMGGGGSFSRPSGGGGGFSRNGGGGGAAGGGGGASHSGGGGHSGGGHSSGGGRGR